MIGQGSQKPGILYKRVMLKISGESLMGKLEYGIDPKWQLSWSRLKRSTEGVEVCLVIGGGNIFRGVRCCRWDGCATGDFSGT